MTSPPYYGLRNYHGEQQIAWPPTSFSPQVGIPIETAVPSWFGALGYEPTIDLYVGHLVLICREIKRVLRPDGTFWLNLGDSYSGSGGAGGDYGPGGSREGQPKYPGRKLTGFQDGDLVGMPFRVALALQADGWIWRNDPVWAKHPMPEPRKGWRYERPPCSCVTERRESLIQTQMEEQGIDRHRVYEKAGTAIEPDPDCPRCHGTGRHGDHEYKPESWRHTASHEYFFMFTKNMGYFSDHIRVATETGANPLDVIHAPRSNYPGKHFAVYPPHLIAPLIHASAPRQCCADCGKPWAPVLHTEWDRDEKKNKSHVAGYQATCEHDPSPAPGIVLDPFIGSGTTGVVAREFGIRFVGCDISFKYLDEQAKLRTKIGQPSKMLDGLPLFCGTEE